MELTILMENHAQDGLCAEHGLSVYIRHGGGELLLDAGESGDFLKNAKELGCPVETVQIAVLSHGHYDHADGFPALLKVNPFVTIYARPGVLEEEYHGEEYIGLCEDLRKNYINRLQLSDEFRSIAPGVYLVPDQVIHEQSLVVEAEDGGLVVLNSCCHAGADHVVESVLASMPGRRVKALVGGMHLMGRGGTSTLGKQPDEVRALAIRLTEELGVERVYTGHCTGAPAMQLLQQAAPGHIFAIQAGDVIQL